MRAEGPLEQVSSLAPPALHDPKFADAKLMIHVLFAVLLSNSPEACALPPRDVISGLKIDAQVAFKAGETARAADLWLRARQMYPSCARTYRMRTDLAIRALNALEQPTANTGAPCRRPDLQTARLVRQTHAELMALPGKSRQLNADRRDFSDRLARLPQLASDTAAFLDAAEPSPIAETFDRHARAVAAFGACAEMRAALVRHVIAALPPDTRSPPACDPASEEARSLLREAMVALENAEPAAATSTPEYAELSQRLKSMDAEGPTLSAVRARATSETDSDRAAEAWAGLARELPTCSTYLAGKRDAAVAAVAAWQRNGVHRVAPAERYSLCKELLDAVIAVIEADHGAEADTLAEHASLLRARADLVPPPEFAVEPRAPVAPTSAPSARAGPVKWIYHHLPERNMIELGVFGGIMMPASGLLDGGQGSHQLFDPHQQRDSLIAIDRGQGTEQFWKPYRKVAPEIGLRIAWYAISFLGGEVEGGVMPTRIVVDGSPGERATLFNFRAHLIGQLPFWRIAPFILMGGGMLGTTGALGHDVDPSLNFGGGVKFHLNRQVMLRLDLRDTVAARLGIDQGSTHYPEVLVGLSSTLNRRCARERPAPG